MHKLQLSYKHFLIPLLVLTIIITLLPNKVYGQVATPTYEGTTVHQAPIDAENSWSFASSIKHDSLNNAYMQGVFTGSIDFAPGTDEDIITSNSLSDVYLTKLNADGSYAWTKAILALPDQAVSADNMSIDQQDNIYIMGFLQGTADFDPESGTDIKTSNSNNNYDIFITKINADGSYGWTRTFQVNTARAQYSGFGMALDSQNNFYMNGTLHGTADFDPGPGIDNQTSNGSAFLTKINADGSYGWTRITQGNNGSAQGIEIAIDSQDNIVTGGNFTKTESVGETDFDPGPGTDVRPESGAFVSKFSPDGTYIWTRTAQAIATQQGVSFHQLQRISIDALNNIYFTGYFSGTVDFDQSANTDVKVSRHNTHITKINTDGSYGWTKVYQLLDDNIPGAINHADGWDITFDIQNNVYWSNTWVGRINFNPDGSGDIRQGTGSPSQLAYAITSLSNSGNYLWTVVTGNGENNNPNYLSIGSNNQLYMLTTMQGQMNFNPDGQADIINGFPNGSLTVAFTKYNLSTQNSAPVLDQIGNKTVNEGQLLEFTINAEDPDGDDLTYSAANLPPGATFNSQTRTFSWTPNFNQKGNYDNIEFTVTDNGSPMGLDAELITITVGDINRTPEFDLADPKEVNENENLSFTVSASDPDGDNFILSVANLPSGATFDAQTGTFSWTPTLSQSDVYVVTFNATDDGSPSETGSIDVTVTVGDVPTPEEQAENLVEQIINIDVPPNVENSYLSNLKKVEIFIQEGKIQAAINQLNAFINKVNQDYAAGTITQSVRDELIGLAQALLADLQ